jgi:cytochrome c peroxidase
MRRKELNLRNKLILIRVLIISVAFGIFSSTAAAQQAAKTGPIPAWELANPVKPLPNLPLGINRKWADLPSPPTPERVRLGRWLFYDKRLSADGTISCATCHISESAFAEPKAISVGIRGQQLTFLMPDGRRVTRKTPSLINETWTLKPFLFWDGRVQSLDELDILPVANPQAMGSNHDMMVQTLKANGYGQYFKEAFGTDEIKKEQVAKAIADYQRTRISGNSPWDRWKRNKEESAVSEDVKKGDQLFFGKAKCATCHFGENFTDSNFHNLGIGWNRETKTLNDTGRFNVTKMDADKGAFRTPTLRDVSLHPPYMHDGSIATLRDVVEHYNKGGNQNPTLDPLIKPLGLNRDEVDALVKWMEALKGEGYQDTAPTAFPQAAR